MPLAKPKLHITALDGNTYVLPGIEQSPPELVEQASRARLGKIPDEYLYAQGFPGLFEVFLPLSSIITARHVY